MTAPDYTAGVEAWCLAGFVGRNVWARPHDGPDLQEPQWVELEKVWMEHTDQDTVIVGMITWAEEPALARWSPANRVEAELTKDEYTGSREGKLPGGITYRSYDPWDNERTPMEVIDYQWKLPAPKPQVVPTEFGDQYTLL